MSEIPPETPGDHSQSDLIADDQEPARLPRWVFVLIAAVLVAMGTLAIYTGVRYRGSSMTRIVRPSHIQGGNSPAPPGEPEPGASLVFPGDSGDTTPAAHPAVSGRARAVINGTGSSIEVTERVWVRRGVMFKVEPSDAVVYVNEVPVGQASQFSAEPYEFAQPGSYTIRLVAPGYHERSYVITADPHAKGEVAVIHPTLRKG